MPAAKLRARVLFLTTTWNCCKSAVLPLASTVMSLLVLPLVELTFTVYLPAARLTKLATPVPSVLTVCPAMVTEALLTARLLPSTTRMATR